MKAFIVDRYKSKSAVRLGDMPEPEIRDDDVLVQIHAIKADYLLPLDRVFRGREWGMISPTTHFGGKSRLSGINNLQCAAGVLESRTRTRTRVWDSNSTTSVQKLRRGDLESALLKHCNVLITMAPRVGLELARKPLNLWVFFGPFGRLPSFLS
ncbi:MAG: hypothetical protein ACREV7_20305 [Steroidobacteraceae bacterium]